MSKVRPIVNCIFDSATNTAQYIVHCPETRKCALIDTVWDFDAPSGKTSHGNVDKLVKYVTDNALEVQWILETHVHADHLTASHELKQIYPNATTGIGDGVLGVLVLWKGLLDLPHLPTDGSQFDRLFADGDTFNIGNVTVNVIHTPGHTPACVTYVAGDAAFCGDSVFMPDAGSARCDFPKGSATTLYDSVVHKIYALPPNTRLFVGHDYGIGGREISWETTVGAEIESNAHLNAKTDESSFVSWRSKRDTELGMPKLIIPAIQVNLLAGRLPAADPNGKTFLKYPINLF